MRIGTDTDEVVAEYVKGYLKFYNTLKGTNFRYEDMNCYDFWTVLGISKREAFGIEAEFFASPTFDDLGLVEGASRGVRALPIDDELFILTARPVWIEDKTRRFYERRFPEIPVSLHFSGDVYKEQGKTKGELCKELELDLFIDDSANALRGCCGNRTRLLLFDRQWNEREEVAGAERTFGWGHVLEKLGVTG